MMITGMGSVTVLLLMASSVLAVDRANFKTCDQSGFCRRNRAMTPGQTPYTALLDTLEYHLTSLSIHLLNKHNQVRLVLELIGLDGGMVRVKIREHAPIRARYEPPIGDVLVQDPVQKDITVEKMPDSVRAHYNDHTVVITADPFRLDVTQGAKTLITINSRGLFKFEHYRTKDGHAAGGLQDDRGVVRRVGGAIYSWFSRPFSSQHEREPDGQPVQMNQEGEGDNKPADVPQPNPPQEDEKDVWEETFRSHTDSKPHGPSSVGVDIDFPGSQNVYGIPEHADTLSLKSTTGGEPYRLYNLDVFEYDLHNPMALYGSIPFMIAHSVQRTVGVFWLNPSEMWIDINNKADRNVLTKVVDFVKGDNELPAVETRWMAEGGNLDLFILLGPTPNAVFRQYSLLTGTTPLPPLFALAYHQSRWNYNDEQDVYSVDDKFDEYDIPMDCIWLDIEHTDGKRYFTWDKTKFPHPGDMVRNISTKGRKMVTIIDPHIKRDSNWDVHTEAQNNGYYVKNKDGGDFDGWCWPGSSSYLDFLSPDIRKWWAGRFSPSNYEGSSAHLFTWNDMNEPSVFNGPEVTMHKDCKHVGNWEHRDIHNIYGMYHVMATMQGQIDRSKNQERPFVLSRAFFAGSQRYGAVWTGDNSAEWSHLKISLPMIMSLSLAGITFSGADVGGFFRNPDAELLTRWYQAAAYQPFFRAHAHLDTRRREPWLLPESNRLIIREAIRARYALLPYWYTLFYEAEQTGQPIMKPLWVEFPQDERTFHMEEEHLVGSALLVHPVTEPSATTVQVYMPGSEEVWYDTETAHIYPGGHTYSIAVTLRSIPVYQRGGSIIATKERIRRSSILGRHDPYTLYVALNKKGEAVGSLYIDDYHTFRYRNKQEFIHREIVFRNNALDSRVLTKGGKYSTKSWLEKVVIYGIKNKPARVEITSPHMSAVPLAFGLLADKEMLVIRKPAVNLGLDWTITLK